MIVLLVDALSEVEAVEEPHRVHDFCAQILDAFGTAIEVDDVGDDGELHGDEKAVPDGD